MALGIMMVAVVPIAKPSATAAVMSSFFIVSASQLQSEQSASASAAGMTTAVAVPVRSVKPSSTRAMSFFMTIPTGVT